MIDNQNRAFMYGESVFTTLRVVNGVPCDWEFHFERLRKGVEYVYGPFIEEESWAALLKNRLDLIFENDSHDRVLRIALYREASRGLKRGSIISIADLKLHFSSTSLEEARNDMSVVNLRSCMAPTRPSWWPAFLKAGSYLDIILALKINLRPGDDDLLFLSPLDTVLESSVANIFVVRHNKLFTAPIGPNVLDGVMRKRIMAEGHHFFDEVREAETTLEQLQVADAVFGSNSVRGVFLIGKIDDLEIKYEPDFLSKFEKMKMSLLS